MSLTIANDLALSSPAFADGDRIPHTFTCDGDNTSPPLTWTPGPRGTRSFALIMEDPDAPNRVWSHWVVCNLPPTATSLSPAVEPLDVLPNGARQGLNDFGNVGYGGPCPPEASHRYVFRLFALDAVLLIPPRFSRMELLRVMQGRILAESRLSGHFQRRLR